MKTGIIVSIAVSCLVAMIISCLLLLDVSTLVLFLTIPILIFGGLVTIFSLPFIAMKENPQLYSMRS